MYIYIYILYTHIIYIIYITCVHILYIAQTFLRCRDTNLLMTYKRTRCPKACHSTNETIE